MRRIFSTFVHRSFISQIFVAILIFLTLAILLTVAIRLVMGSLVLGIDFHTFWSAARALFIRHINPYSQAVIDEMQFARYNRLALPGEDQLAYVYPLHMLWLVFPFAFLDFPLAQALWMTVQILALSSVLFLLFKNKSGLFAISAMFIYPFTFSIILGNFNLTIGIFLILFFWLYFNGRLNRPSVQVLLGVGLTFAVFKPQFVLLPISFAFLVLIKNRNWRIIFSFLISTIVLMSISFILIPDWLTEWIHRVRMYPSYTETTMTIARVFHFLPGEKTILSISVLILIILLSALIYCVIIWWRRPAYHSDNGMALSATGVDSIAGEIFILGFAGLITYLGHPIGRSYEQIIILVPFTLWAAMLLPVQRKPILIFWWLGLAISWAAFFTARYTQFSQAIYTLPVMFFSGWLIYLWITSRPFTQKELSNAS